MIMLLIKYMKYHEDTSCYNDNGVKAWFLKLWVTTPYKRSGGGHAQFKDRCQVLKNCLKLAPCMHSFGRSVRFNIDALGKCSPTPAKCFTNFCNCIGTFYSLL